MQSITSDKKLISIVIPCYCSEKTIKNVVDEIDDTFSKQSKYDYEVILVNDGSPDNTYAVISAICDTNPHVTGVNLSRNYGQSSAKMAGFKYVNGEIMISMDDDGQHPVEEIFTLAEKIQEGYDIVFAHFKKKKQSMFKKVTSWLSDKMMVLLGNRKSEYHVSSFIAYSSFSIKAIKECDCPVPAGAIFISRISNKVTSIPMEQRKRKEGKSNYTLRRMLQLWRKNITHFSTKVLDFSYYFGFFMLFASFVCGIGMIVIKILNPEVSIALAIVICIMLFLAGIIMFLLGILGDYIGKIYMIEIKKPNYYVRNEHLNMFAKNK